MISKIVISITFISSYFYLIQNNENKLEQLKSNKSLYTSFTKFYNDSIRKEIKDEWGKPYYYKIDQINGLHYFDYNYDGSKDALVEFSAAACDGGTFYFLTAVLFTKTDKSYSYKAHFYPNDTGFVEYSKPYFLFSGTKWDRQDRTAIIKYQLKGNQFIEE